MSKHCGFGGECLWNFRCADVEGDGSGVVCMNVEPGVRRVLNKGKSFELDTNEKFPDAVQVRGTSGEAIGKAVRGEWIKSFIPLFPVR